MIARLILHFGPDPAVLVSSSDDFDPPPDTSAWPAAIPDHRKIWGFADCRIAELVDDIGNGRVSRPLCTPEFTLGFIGSDTLVTRLRTLLDQGLSPLHFDFIQTIARCHPLGDEIPDGEDEASRVLRYRLTGEVVGSTGKPAWWLAAARAREPDGDFSHHPHFSKFHVEGQSDWTTPAIWREPSTIGSGGLGGLNARKYIDWSDPDRREDLLYNHDKIPTDHIYPLQHASSGYDPFAISWRYSFTPGFLDAVIAEDITHTFYTVSGTSRSNIDSAAAVMVELAKRRPLLRQTMQVHLLLALGSPGQAEREAAVDLFLQASEDGRLADATTGLGIIFRQLMIACCPHPDTTMRQMSEKSFVVVPILQLGRAVPPLRELSTHGPLLQIHLRDLLLTSLEESLSEVPKGFPGLLEVVLDLVTAHPPGRKIDLNTVWSNRLTGKSKSLAARICKAST